MLGYDGVGSRAEACLISIHGKGLNQFGQLGLARDDNRLSDPRSLPAVDVGGSGQAIAVGAGWGHTCVLMKEKSVRCWGERCELSVSLFSLL